MNEIISLHIYPIKSLAGIDLNSAQALSAGMQWDRRWMLVDDENVFMTQRKLNQLCLFKQKLSEAYLEVGFQNEQIRIPLNEVKGDSFVADIWGHKTPVTEVDQELSKWFSARLESSCRLVRMNLDGERIQQHEEGERDLKMNLADGYPYLVLGTASLDNLNRKLQVEVGADRFRPNILIRTNTAHEEDEWNEFELGTARFKISHPCARCKVITIDQQTAEQSKEPLKTLSGYRKVGERVNFGANAYCISEGALKVGDVLADIK